MSDNETTDLTGKLLVAMPGMGDPRFMRSVILICAHSDDGAMGLIINKPTKDVQFADLLKQHDIDVGPDLQIPKICVGGPVEHARGFVLHRQGYSSGEATMDVPGGYGMTASLEILQDMAGGKGPDGAILALGYSGWGPGQLEEELAANGWLVCDPSPDLIFNAEHPEKWTLALATLGVDALSLSATGGTA